MNGIPVEEDLVFAWAKKRTIRKYRIHEAGEPFVELPAYSYAFVVID